MRRSLIAAAVFVGFVSAPVVYAAPQGFLHKVKSDSETYALLAEHYYGQRHAAHHLMVQNRYREPLEPGTTIVIPTWRVKRFKKGDSLEGFAKDNLGKKERADYLRTLHGLKPQQQPKVGARLRVPPTVRHRVRVGESYASIARTYFNSASKQRQELLRLYNGLAKGGLRVGSNLRVPLDAPMFSDARVQRRAKTPIGKRARPAQASAPPPPSKKSRPAGTKKGRPKSRPDSKTAAAQAPAEEAPAFDSQAEIETVSRLFDEGKYKSALAASEKLHQRADSKTTKIEALRLWASSLVAFGRFDEAERRFRDLLKLKPDYRLDLYLTSPKILDVFETARR